MPCQKLFSHAEATDLLPRVREVVSRVRDLHEELTDELSDLRTKGVEPFGLRVVGSAELPVSLARRRERVHVAAREIEDEIARLQELDVELKAFDGLVDFHSLHDGHVVHLCWRWGEPGIDWWHDLGAGFAGRQPIEDPSLFRGDGN